MTDILNNKNPIMITAGLLTAFSIFGAALVGLTYSGTEDDIKLNEKRTLLAQLNHIIPESQYDNDLILDTVTLPANYQLGTETPTQAYRARKQGKNVAVVFTATAPNGYNGPIDMLVGVYADGSVAGVRVVKHRETPGLGDAIMTTHSDWILSFNNKSLENPKESGWKVKRDGGEFDQFTGATITPRAVVKAIRNALLYFNKNSDSLFAIADSASYSDTATEAKPKAQATPDKNQAK